MRKSFIYLLLLFVAIGCHMEVPLSPVASFQMTPASGCQAPCQVTFTSTSQHATSLEWDFDDGTKAKGADPQTHEFTYGKKFYVKLIAGSADGGSQGVTQIIEIKAVAASKPEADFIYTFEKADVLPAKVLFSNKSKNGERYEWNFGDEQATTTNLNTSTEQNPAHTYSKIGKYKVTLTAYNIENKASTPVVKEVEVTVLGPVAAFTITGGDCSAPCEVSFNNKSTSAKTYSWDFGDGSPKSEEASPKHTYAKDGTYTVTLTVVGDGGQGVTQDKVIIKKGEVNAISISSEFNFPSDIIADAAGNIYVCGITRGETKFGDARIYSSNSNRKDDFFIAKYNKTGQMIWAYVDGSAENDGANGMTLDDKGNVYVTGFVGGAMRINNVSPQGNSDGFVAKFNASGERQWFTLFGGPSNDDGAALAFYNKPEGSRVYLAGNVTGDPVKNNINFFNGSQATFAVDEDLLFAFLDADNGIIKEPAILRSNGSQRVNALKVDADGNAYLVGTFNNSIIFPGADPGLMARGQSDAFVAKWILSSGRFQWARQVGSVNEDSGYDLAIDNNRNVYVTGRYIGPLDPLGVGSRGDINVFLGKWDAEGRVLWGRSGFNNGNNDFPGGVAISPSGNILVSGSYPGTGTFPFDNNTSFESKGSTDMIVAEVKAADGLTTGRFQVTGGGTSEDKGIRICISPDGYLYSTGYFSGNATFNGTELVNGSAKPNTYIVKYKIN